MKTIVYDNKNNFDYANLVRLVENIEYHTTVQCVITGMAQDRKIITTENHSKKVMKMVKLVVSSVVYQLGSKLDDDMSGRTEILYPGR